MKTQIFADWSAFVARDDRTLNGVDQAFADANPGWDEERGNESCWDCSGCSCCSGCSRCSRCSGCSCCKYEHGASNKRGNVVPSPDIPTIPNIHRAVLEAVTASPDALDMGTWHRCETTHCRASWVVQLAGEKGKALEAFHDTPLAAFLIYQASSPELKVTFPRFYDENEAALADIRRMAELEAALAHQGQENA